MKRIGIEVQRLFRKKKHGMEVVALELIKQLQEIDHNNEYIVYAKDDVDDTCITESKHLKIQKLPGKTYFDWEQISLAKAVNTSNLDFLHSTCNTSALNVKKPLLLTLHDIIYLEELNFKGSAYQNFGNLYRKFVVPKVVKKCRFVITVSHFEKNTIIEKLKLPEEKVKVVYNAVNSRFNNEYSNQAVAAFKQQYRLPQSFILFLGNTAPKKNTRNVLNAYCQYCHAVKDAVPLVILDYEKDLVMEELKRTGNEKLIQNFIFPGFITSNEMPLMYNAATLFLYPSLRESFGLPILEAMGCGTPVITSTTSSMPEVGGDAAIYVDPFRVSDIAEKIETVISDEQLQQQLKEKGIKRASAFNWKKSAEDLMEIYNEM